MGGTLKQPNDALPLPLITQLNQPTVADRVFEELRQRILNLDLPPRTKISEAEVAKTMGVSRQPVREAFKRLAKIGFLVIRPQSGTTVSLISGEAVLRARFVRTALEVKTCRTLCTMITPAGRAALSALIEQQREAVKVDDRSKFHAADDAFHREICVLAGVEYVWDLLTETKTHMDRIRMLSLDSTSQKLALKEHVELFDAICNNKPDVAEDVISNHLSRILLLIDELKEQNHTFFTDAAT
ncbi:GntR family transcriptional regulator [Phaeobacter sp. B1627]|uniref:GntR family transcriptional regulator n=1 Tax=Phaeobacter sp. B1627 TaxID=2583809 RepID=UPI001117E956|nr:GntR family transcriptional regulator [Phaeobacter sp. B1627]TNJ44482.1 GntR family transcriptional regulator [Phaeobacter sp. B1627]